MGSLVCPNEVLTVTIESKARKQTFTDMIIPSDALFINEW